MNDIKDKIVRKKVLIVGGHLAPALAVIEELNTRGAYEIFWVGRKYAMEVGKVPSLEYELIPPLGIPFYDLRTGRLQRRFTSQTLPSLLRIIPGLAQAKSIVSKIRPNVVMSFGGYLSVPVVIAAWLSRVPIVVHEQTVVLGLANRIAARFATRIAVSFPESAADFKGRKVVVTGNPVSRSILDLKRKPDGKLIYVTGGGQGSQTINNYIEELLPDLTPHFSIVHQTGTLDYPRFKSLEKKFKNYKVAGTMKRDEVVRIFERASLIISRGGANTISEIAASGIPAIIIPIPGSARDEQEKNAQLLAKTGLAAVLHQADLSRSTLLERINLITSNPPVPTSHRLALELVNPKAALEVCNLIEEVAK